jgi:hypothetical protein
MFSVIALLCALQAAAICPYPNGGQFECHTTPADVDVTIFEVSAIYHANPVRVCDYNSHALSAGECYGTEELRKNFTLRVPQAACVPMPGISCYEVQEHNETLETVAFSPKSVFRSVDRILHYNKHTLWGQTKLFKGMHLRLPNPPCIPEHGNPNAPLSHTVKEGDDLASIADFYETDQATLLSHNAERLGPHPYSTTVTVGMQLRVPHPHPHPDPTKPCEPDKWGDLWSCYHVPDRSHNHIATAANRKKLLSVDDDNIDDDQAILAGQDLYEIAQLRKADPYQICELNPTIDCSPAFYCNGTTPGLHKCSVFVKPTSVSGVALTVAHTSCAVADPSISCAKVPLDELPFSDNNYGKADLALRGTAPGLKARGPSPEVFNYKLGTGSDIAMQWYQTHMNLNAFALPKYQAGLTGPIPCLQRNPGETSLVSIDSCTLPPGMVIKVPTAAACATADPNACYTIGPDDMRVE